MLIFFVWLFCQHMALSSWKWVLLSFLHFVHFVPFFMFSGRCRYATARIDNLCEDWAGDYYPHLEGQDPHRVYVQPFCSLEYHPRPHAHGIYAGPYSLRRRCMGGLAAHRLVAHLLLRLALRLRLISIRFLHGGDNLWRQKQSAKEWIPCTIISRDDALIELKLMQSLRHSWCLW